MGLGRSGNGHAEGLQLLRSLTYPRASLVEHRPFDAHALLPGINWTGTARREPSVAAFDPDEETGSETPTGARGAARHGTR